MKLTALVNQEVKIPLTVVDQVDGSPLSGLLDGDFSKLLLRDDVDESGAVTVTVTEVVSGRYSVAFTPNARGLWMVSIETPDGSIYEFRVDVGLFNTVETVRKETSNRHEIDFGAQEEIAYDDDGVTPIQRWPLTTDGGESVTTQHGVQTRRGNPLLPRD
jgi:hypothetical protein